MVNREQVLQRVQWAIVAYDTNMRQSNAHQDEAIRRAGDQFLDVLKATDALQAQLVITGYLLCGGTDDSAALQAARAIQMVHCSLDKTIAGSPASRIGLHAAEITLANMAGSAESRLKALSITNRSLLLRAQASASSVPSPDLLATEAVLNPLHVGMVLADAACDATDAITPYALAMGRYYIKNKADYLQEAQTAREQLTFWPSAELQLLDDIFDTFIANRH